ncbi:MAG: DASS family sodium-coupled anion symporter [Nanoarchaeota archaeon]
MLKTRNYVYILISIAILLVTLALDMPIPFQAKVVLAITLFTGVMWLTEALPLHITGMFAAFLLVVCGGFSAEQVFHPFFDPIMVLLLGGFVLAVGMQKHKLDEFMALNFLNRFGNDPKFVLLGIMSITAFLSLWITNTASTLIMLPIVISILKYNGLKALRSSYGKAMVLGVAFAATIGGIGTIIGSTPNAIAVKFLADQGVILNFLDWMAFGIPIVIIMIPITWLLLIYVFKPEIKHLHVKKFKKKITKNQKIVLGIFLVTVVLWLTTAVHGITASVISVVPIILLYLFGMLRGKDFSKVNWAALILFGSGLSVGVAIHNSGLDSIIASTLSTMMVGQPIIIILFAVVIIGVLLTAIASNTAAAAMFVPIIMPLAAAFGIDIIPLTILAAIAVSLDMIVPVGTPPNTIAYSSGYIKMKDMVKAGTIITAITMFVLVGLFFLW